MTKTTDCGDCERPGNVNFDARSWYVRLVGIVGIIDARQSIVDHPGSFIPRSERAVGPCSSERMLSRAIETRAHESNDHRLRYAKHVVATSHHALDLVSEYIERGGRIDADRSSQCTDVC